VRVLVPLLVRLLSTLLALALIAVGVVLVVEIVSAWLGSGWAVLPDDTAERLSRTRWDERTPVLVFAAMALVGLLALTAGLWRRPPLTVPLESDDDIVVERYSLERSVRRRLDQLDGVTASRVRVTGRRLVARIVCNRALPPDDIRADATAAIASVLDRYGLPLRPQLTVRFRGGTL
jgi:hypothetical protein